MAKYLNLSYDHCSNTAGINCLLLVKTAIQARSSHHPLEQPKPQRWGAEALVSNHRVEGFMWKLEKASLKGFTHTILKTTIQELFKYLLLPVSVNCCATEIRLQQYLVISWNLGQCMYLVPHTRTACTSLNDVNVINNKSCSISEQYFTLSWNWDLGFIQPLRPGVDCKYWKFLMLRTLGLLLAFA